MTPPMPDEPLPASVWLGAAIIGESGGLVSGFDEQRSDLIVLEGEVVTKRDRTSWEVAADFGRDDELLAVARDASHVRSRLRVCCSPVNPRRDFGTIVIVGLVIDVSIRGEQREKIGKLAGVGGVEEASDSHW